MIHYSRINPKTCSLEEYSGGQGIVVFGEYEYFVELCMMLVRVKKMKYTMSFKILGNRVLGIDFNNEESKPKEGFKILKESEYDQFIINLKDVIT